MTISDHEGRELDPRHTHAAINPLVPRYLTLVASERGYDVDRLCRGLGFVAADLSRPHLRLSYRQASLMIRRAQAQIPDADLALAVGRRQTLVSWGLVGFGMMTCKSVGDALALGIRFQKSVASMVSVASQVGPRGTTLIVEGLFHDPDIERFLIEETLASVVSVTRQLVGADFQPEAVELAYAEPGHAALYQSLFRCPVYFGAPNHSLVIGSAALQRAVPTHDPLVALTLRPLIEANFARDREQARLGETIERTIRDNLGHLPSLPTIAASLNLSERTLRRKLTDAGFTYQGMLDAVRKARALELLAYSKKSVAEVAQEIGFNDVRNFRRAFRRWTGAAPADLRN